MPRSARSSDRKRSVNRFKYGELARALKAADVAGKFVNAISVSTESGEFTLHIGHPPPMTPVRKVELQQTP